MSKLQFSIRAIDNGFLVESNYKEQILSGGAAGRIRTWVGEFLGLGKSSHNSR
ncbi:MAG: hypothetical protein ABSF82_13020 [Candidatus Bathyarchaeia archaeon]